MSLPQRDEQHHTYGEYLQWPDDRRYELIDGVAYAMTPAPTRRHQEVLLEIARQVANALLHHACKAFIAPFDVRLPKGDEADEQVDTVVQPDLSVVCDPDKLDERGCRGAPDWVVEVLSPATASHDHKLKRAVYERAGVPGLRHLTWGRAGTCSENRREYVHVSSTSASLPPKFSEQVPAPLFNSLCH